MAQQPKEHEIGKCLTVHHRSQIELHVCLPRDAVVVAQQSELQTVGDKAPHRFHSAIQQFLDQAVRAGASRASYARCPVVEIDVPSYKMNRNLLPGMGHRIATTVDLTCSRWLQTSVPKFRKERQQPL